MEIYTSKTTQQDLPAEFHVYYSKSRLLAGVVITVCVMAFCIYMATDPYKKGVLVPVFWGAFALGCALLIVKSLRAFANASCPVVTISREGIRFNNGKFAPWSNIAENTYHTQSTSGLTTGKALQLKLHNGKPIKFSAMALALSSDRYLEMCDLYSAQATA